MDPKEKQTQVMEVTMEDLKSLIFEGVNEVVGELKSEIIKETQVGLKEFKVVTDDEKMEKAAQFVKDICLGNLEVKAVDSSDGSFGYTVPTELANYIIDGVAIDNIPTCGLVGIELDIKNWGGVAENSGKLFCFEYPKKFTF